MDSKDIVYEIFKKSVGLKRCKICGKIFCTDYGLMGYIDHVNNFSGDNFRYYCNSNASNAVQEITTHGNEIRSLEDIKERLNCFLKWPDVSDDVKEETKRRCEFLIDKMQKSQDKADKIVSGMTSLERKSIIEAALCGKHEIDYNSDGKLWDGFNPQETNE